MRLGDPARLSRSSTGMISSKAMVTFLAPPRDIQPIRDRLVEQLYRLIIPLGTLGILLAMWRNHASGIPFRMTTAVLGLNILMLLGVHLARRRVPTGIRSLLLLAVLSVATFLGVWNIGVAAPSVVLIPCVVVLAWLLLGNVGAAIAFGGLAIGLCASAVVHLSGEPSPTPLLAVEINRRPLFWLQLGMLIGIATLLVIVTIHSLLLQLVDRELQVSVERDRLKSVIEGIEDCVFVLSENGGVIQQVNRRSLDMLGRQRADLEGRTTSEEGLFPPEWHSLLELRPPEGATAPLSQIVSLVRADGSNFLADTHVRRLDSTHDPKILITIRDVEERERHRLEIERMNGELERRVSLRTAVLERSRRDLQSFASTISHDLRAPLRVIDGYSLALQEDHGASLPAEGIAMIERIRAGCTRMSRLIEALLDLARIDRQPVRRVAVDMGRIVQEIRDDLDSVVGPTRIVWHVDPLLPCSSDPDLVRLVWANLLGNAVKFSAHRDRPEISVRTIQRDDGHWYEVRDNGSGFDMARAHNLFGMFRRLHDGNVEGLGIGLATVKRIVDHLDGAIEFHGVPDAGATFLFRPYPPPGWSGP